MLIKHLPRSFSSESRRDLFKGSEVYGPILMLLSTHPTPTPKVLLLLEGTQVASWYQCQSTYHQPVDWGKDMQHQLQRSVEGSFGEQAGRQQGDMKGPSASVDCTT